MKNPPRNALSSRDLMQKIGLGDTPSPNLLIDDEPLDSPIDNLAEILRSRYLALQTPHPFKPGDLVTWKPGMQNKLKPGYGQPAVVLEVLQTPIFDGEKEAGSAYFREPLDLVLGLIYDEGGRRGDFVVWYFDSRRFQPWTSAEASQ